uniref:Uncharacterized protein n=1 Tax=Anopheles minimus TaxID=112268 RepID=A0A182WQ86_9DIPT
MCRCKGTSPNSSSSSSNSNCRNSRTTHRRKYCRTGCSQQCVARQWPEPTSAPAAA